MLIYGDANTQLLEFIMLGLFKKKKKKKQVILDLKKI